MKLQIIPGSYSILQLPACAPIPDWVYASSFCSITKTSDELSIVCEGANNSFQGKTEDNWALIKIAGPLDFSLTGILSSLANPLAQNGISLFAISTFDTDYILVKKESLGKSVEILGKSNFEFI